MYKNVNDLVIKLGKKFNKTSEIQEKVLEIFHNDWFDSLESIRKIPNEMWDEYFENYPDYKDFLYEIKNVLKTKEIKQDFQNLLIKMSENIEPLENFIQVLAILNKIVKNIIDFPNDLNKRKLRLSNVNFFEKIGKFQPCLDFLFYVFFL